MRSTLGQQQQNLGLGLTIIRPVLERIQGFLLRVETRMIFCIDKIDTHIKGPNLKNGTQLNNLRRKQSLVNLSETFKSS